MLLSQQMTIFTSLESIKRFETPLCGKFAYPLDECVILG